MVILSLGRTLIKDGFRFDLILFWALVLVFLLFLLNNWLGETNFFLN